MAIITEDLNIETSWNLNTDIATITSKINHVAQGMATRRVIFIGENHNSSYDKTRNLAIAEQFSNTDNIILVVERGMFDNAPHINLSQSVITEQDIASSSLSPLRNQRIVEQLLQAISAEQPHTYPKAVVFIFGQDHEDKIREQLCNQMPHDQRLCWWSFKSIIEAFEAYPPRNRSVSGEYSLLGFASHTACDNLELKLLEKGLLFSPVGVAIHPPYNPPRNEPLSAIYMNKNAPRHDEYLEDFERVHMPQQIQLTDEVNFVAVEWNSRLTDKCPREITNNLLPISP